MADKTPENPPLFTAGDSETDFTIRDLFAAAALAGLAVRLDATGPDIGARFAYAYADAMLQAREAAP